MKKVFSLFFVAALVLGLSGCGGFAGMGPIGHGSKVSLSSKNFTVLKSNVSGSAKVTVLFPINAPFLGQLGLPLGEADLYHKAMVNLRKNANIGNDAKNIGLVNLTVDEHLKHFLVIGWKTITITADVVEFSGQK